MLSNLSGVSRSVLRGEPIFCRALSAFFRPGQSLYRDHLGRRVVFDAEGPGWVSVRGDVDVVYGQWQDQSFADGLTLAAPDGAAVEVRAVLGLPVGGEAIVVEETPHPSLRRVGLPDHDLSDLGPAPFHADLIDAFDIADLAALSQRGFACRNISERVPLGEVRVASFLTAATWNVNAPCGAVGLILRRTYDAFHGRQRARVLLQGEMAGWWYDPIEERGSRRVATSAFAMALNPSSEPRSVAIAIDPPAGTPLFSLATLQVYGIWPESPRSGTNSTDSLK